MRRPPGRTSRRLISPTWIALLAGWAVVAVVFIALIAEHRLQATFDSLGAAISAAAAWLALVLLASSVDELWETITNTPEADRRSRRSPGWRPAWGPVAAALVGIAVGWVAWK
jgi:hypothetical protein